MFNGIIITADGDNCKNFAALPALAEGLRYPSAFCSLLLVYKGNLGCVISWVILQCHPSDVE